VKIFHNRLCIVCGATASGKSSIGVDLAEAFNGEVLSCDSIQFYRGMDIGSAKLTGEECKGIPHHGIDLVEINDHFNVGRYVAYAKDIVLSAQARGKNIFVVGGSGFYLKSFYGPIVDGISISEETKKFAAQIYANEGMAGIEKRLLNYQKRLPRELMCNPVRALHALERCVESGKSLEEMAATFQKRMGVFDHLKKYTIYLHWSKDSLQNRIRMRVQSMLHRGLIEEVKKLKAQGLEQHATLCQSVGYREMLDVLNGRLKESDVEDHIVSHTHRLVRKQNTWFRHQICIDLTVNMDSRDSKHLLFEFLNKIDG
jgi:tRNA dimethylallyltransferase